MPSTLGIVASGYSGFSPLNLSPALWLDASDTATITSTSSKVSQWSDKSGNGRHMAQATSANQPSTGASLNGRNAITFGSAASMTTSTFSVSQPITVCAVFRTTTNFETSKDSEFSILVENASTTVRPIWFLRHVDYSNSPTLYAGGFASAAPKLTNSTNYVLTGQMNGVSSLFRMNGAARTLATNSGTASVSDGLRLGGSASGVRMMSDLCELLVFGTISATEIGQVESYLNAKWAVY